MSACVFDNLVSLERAMCLWVHGCYTIACRRTVAEYETTQKTKYASAETNAREWAEVTAKADMHKGKWSEYWEQAKIAGDMGNEKVGILYTAMSSAYCWMQKPPLSCDHLHQFIYQLQPAEVHLLLTSLGLVALATLQKCKHNSSQPQSRAKLLNCYNLHAGQHSL